MTGAADDAGGGPGAGEGGAGLGAAEAQDEAVHLFEELADFREAEAEAEGEEFDSWGHRENGVEMKAF